MSANPVPSDLPAGTELCGYQLAGLLGKGGMGAVYRATQLSLGRPVALKVLSGKLLGSQEKIDKFLKEARIAASLSHPGLVTIHEVGQDQLRQLYFYSMELVQGRTLRTVIQQEGPLRRELALSIGQQIAAALAHAHKQGLMHRDVKPENIILTQNHTAKLADLGLATAEARGHNQTGPRVLSIVGTPGWSAPEQLRAPASVTPESDVFALGCLISYMLTGEDPFTGITLLDLAVNVATEPVAGLSSIPSLQIRDLIEHLTAKDPTQRPESGEAALVLFEQITGSARRRTTNSSDASISSSTANLRNRRRRVRRR